MEKWKIVVLAEDKTSGKCACALRDSNRAYKSPGNARGRSVARESVALRTRLSRDKKPSPRIALSPPVCILRNFRFSIFVGQFAGRSRRRGAALSVSLSSPLQTCAVLCGRRNALVTCTLGILTFFFFICV